MPKEKHHKHFEDRKPLKGTFVNSEDQDEMPHNVAFYQGLHYLLRQNWSSEKEIQHFLDIISCDPSIYTMDHSDSIVCSFMKNSIGLKRVSSGGGQLTLHL